VQPLRRHDQVDAAVVGRNGEPRLRAEERLILHADFVGAFDDDGSARGQVAPLDVQIAEDVAVGVERWRGECGLGVDHRVEQFVVHADGRAGSARSVRMVGRDTRDRFADMPHDVVGEHRLVGVLEAVTVAVAEIVARQHGPHAGDRKRRTDVDRADAGGRMRRAQRLAPQHPLRPQVVREGELAAHLRAAVGPARARTDAALDDGRCGADRARRARHPPRPTRADRIASNTRP
jgi:hypothetical protein